jgi:Rad3-related DNA helicase
MTNQLLSYFPFDDKITELRPNQQEALNAIWDAIVEGKTRVMLSGPVGSGKSKIGETVLRYFKDNDKVGLYTSPLNSLVDQLEESKHPDSNIKTLKGKSHYDCIARLGYKCDNGYCSLNICSVTKKTRSCKGCENINCICHDCIYKATFQTYRKSKAGNTNMALWLMGIVPKDASVLIIDEVDSLEDFVRMYCTVSVPYHLKSNDFEDHIKYASEFADSLKNCVDCERGYSCKPKNIDRHEQKINKILAMVYDFEENNESWVIKKEITKSGDIRTRYEPITINRFIDSILESMDFVLAMSATPPHWKDYHFIEVESPFPVDIRQCEYFPIGKMSMNYRDKTIPKLADFLMTLKGKTVVHCVSYATAAKIADVLRERKIFPLLQVNNNNGDGNENNVQRWDAVNAFKTSKDINKILLSVKLDRGVDFWEPEIQNNIIAVVPFQNPTDKLVKAKSSLLGESWKTENTAIAIEQAHGRIHRGVYLLSDVIKYRPELSWLPTNAKGEIIKRTYIIDSNFNNGGGRLMAWYQRNKRFFTKSFNEVVKL